MSSNLKSMYFAEHTTPQGTEFILRRTFFNGELFCSQDLFNLGADPGQYIVYSSDIHYEIKADVLQSLREKGVSYSNDELEELFFPYLDSYIQYKLEPFRNRFKCRSIRKMSNGEKQRAITATHIFDRRRIHYLRFGHCSAANLDQSPKLFRVLLDTSRDEIEQIILKREKELEAREYKNYLFSIFDLQRFFKDKLTRFMVHALNQEAVDDFFLQEYCRLNRDKQFWAGFTREKNRITEYQLRYLIMYFDEDYSGKQQHFYSQDQYYRGHDIPPVSKQKMSMTKAAAVLGTDMDAVKKMSKKEITSLYRKKAHSFHPDKGGDHDKFVELTEAYDELLRSLSS